MVCPCLMLGLRHWTCPRPRLETRSAGSLLIDIRPYMVITDRGLDWRRGLLHSSPAGRLFRLLLRAPPPMCVCCLNIECPCVWRVLHGRESLH